MYVHRAVLLAWGPPIPTGKHQVNHKNGNRKDPRLENLEWVTHQENHKHRVAVMRSGCGSSQGMAKLTEAKVAKIKEMLVGGFTGRSIAKTFGVHYATISDIKVNKCWRHVPW